MSYFISPATGSGAIEVIILASMRANSYRHVADSGTVSYVTEQVWHFYALGQIMRK